GLGHPTSRAPHERNVADDTATLHLCSQVKTHTDQLADLLNACLRQRLPIERGQVSLSRAPGAPLHRPSTTVKSRSPNHRGSFPARHRKASSPLITSSSPWL